MALAKKLDDDALAAAFGPLISDHGLVLESVRSQRVGEQTRINVVVDLPEDEVGSADLDSVTEASRAISELIDSDESLIGPGPSHLEVTTPGVFRPLTELRHFKRSRTRLLALTFDDGRTCTARLTDVEGDNLVLDVQKPPHVPKRAKKKPAVDQPRPETLSPGTHTVPWTTVMSAEVQLEFR